MMEMQDILILALVIVFLGSWILLLLRRWLSRPPLRRLPFPAEAAPPDENVARLLKVNGYRMACGKLKIPLRFRVDGKKLYSRYFIDGLAKEDERWYVVKLEKERMPMEWTGSQVRDRLLPYVLLYDFAEGLLFVDMSQNKVVKVLFDFKEDRA